MFKSIIKFYSTKTLAQNLQKYDKWMKIKFKSLKIKELKTCKLQVIIKAVKFNKMIYRRVFNIAVSLKWK